MKTKKTIFAGNKTAQEVIAEGIIFGVSATLILTFTAAVITLIINLLNH